MDGIFYSAQFISKEQVMKKYLLVLAVAGACGIAWAAETGGGPRGGGDGGQGNGQQRPERPQPKDISGTVKNFNLGPRGNFDGIMMTVDGKLVQVNVPPDVAMQAMAKVSAGD